MTDSLVPPAQHSRQGANGSESVLLPSIDAVVHLEYDDPKSLPSLQQIVQEYGGRDDESWTRFVCISDTHSKIFEIPDGDVLLHAGDLTTWGHKEDMEKVVDWLCGLKHKVKIVIAGNHDLPLHRDWYMYDWRRFHRTKKQDSNAIHKLLTGEKARKAGIIYLENQQTTFQIEQGRREWTVYGSPWTPGRYFTAFQYQRDSVEAREIVSKYSNADILLTHAPPFKIFDLTKGNENAGCEVLANHISQGRLRPRLHVFGHIHEAHGAFIHQWSGVETSEALEIQNTINYPTEAASGSTLGTVNHPDESQAKLEVETKQKTRNVDGELKRTVFVNAANKPSGIIARRNGEILEEFGGPRFRPVVVDLKD